MKPRLTAEQKTMVKASASSLQKKEDLVLLMNQVTTMLYGENGKKAFDIKHLTYYANPSLSVNRYLSFEIKKPDYIFKSNFDGKIFVVEEKFQFVNKDPSDYKNQENFTEFEQEIVRKRKLNRFFSNHENQVNAYVHGIMDPVIDYGYLVYWKYEMDNGLPEIIACSVKKILKNDESKSAFGNAFQEIHKLIKQGNTSFNMNDRSHLKCASCVTGVFCGHKTGRFSEITFPYDLNFLKLKYVEFPEELKKERDVETGNHTSKLQI